jgi:hypothetical protein
MSTEMQQNRSGVNLWVKWSLFYLMLLSGEMKDSELLELRETRGKAIYLYRPYSLPPTRVWSERA